MDVVVLGLAKAFVKKLLAQPVGSLTYTPTMPSGLGWDTTNYPLTATVAEMWGSPRCLATPSVTAKGLFDAASTARSAPGATFYVSTSGLDTNGGTSGAPFKSIWKAIAAANTAAVPTTIFVAAGTYFRSNNPWYNGGAGVNPSVDIALIATGGRVITGTFDTVGTPTRDATQTNTYSWALSNCNRVADRGNLNRFGNYTELVQVSTAALCNATPNSWALVSGTIYVNRADQAAVTDTNTRTWRPATQTLSLRNTASLYVGGQSGNDGFDFEGGSNIGVLDVTINPSSSTRKTIACENATFKYGGGYTDNAAKSVAIDSWQGLTAFFNCRADAGWSDGFNFHNNYSASNMNVLTVNCSGYDNGRGTSASNNGWTSHETVVGIDLAGHYVANRGGSCRSILASKSWFAGTTVENDLGDVAQGGVVPPTAFRADDNAAYWCERTKVLMPAGSLGYVTGASTAAIHRRNVWPTALVDNGPGTFDTY